MTYDEIKLRLEQVLNDNFGDVMRFTDAQVMWAINQGVKRLMDYAYSSPYKDEIFANLLVIDEEQTLSSGSITLTETPYQVLSVRHENGFPIRQITARSIADSLSNEIVGASALDPYFIYDGGTSVKVYGGQDGDVIYATYVKQPTFYDSSTGSSEPEFPEKFQDFLIWYPAHLLASNVESGYENYAEAFLLKAMEIIGISPQSAQSSQK